MTLDNLTKWPSRKVELLRRVLRDEALVPVREAFATERSIPHGHVEAVLGTIRNLGLDKLISSKHCREGDLTVAMVVEQLIHPCSKLATTRLCPSVRETGRGRRQPRGIKTKRVASVSRRKLT